MWICEFYMFEIQFYEPVRSLIFTSSLLIIQQEAFAATSNEKCQSKMQSVLTDCFHPILHLTKLRLEMDIK